MPFALTAATRTELGKRVKNVRNAGKLPAVVYGHGTEPKALVLGVSEFQKLYRTAGSSSLIDLAIDGATTVKVLIQEVQVNHLTLRPQHVDLRQINMKEELEVEVPLAFKGDAPAVKEMAGTLMKAYDAVLVKCLPADLPHEITIDLGVLVGFDDLVTVADLKLPAGVTVLLDPTVSLVSVSAPLTEDQLKKMEEEGAGDVTAVKTEAEEKKAEEEAKKAEETAAAEAAK
ncbi:MAG: 50S ribosomal protein L25 [Patescibacteria group bacterium]|jgi:large subunit ribosomal protein L25